VDAAVRRLQPDQARVGDILTRLMNTTDPADYWAEPSVGLYSAVQALHDVHAQHCIDAGCQSCPAIAEAVAVTDAFELAEYLRCQCPVSDHFTTDCTRAGAS
jgi:hypothetical protein